MLLKLIFKKVWLSALVAGLVLTLVSLLYVASPYGSEDVINRPQLRFGGSTIQITSTPESDELLFCTASLVEEHQGFPAAYVSLYGNDGCSNDRYLEPIGLLLNIAVYSVLAWGVLYFIDRKRRP